MKTKSAIKSGLKVDHTNFIQRTTRPYSLLQFQNCIQNYWVKSLKIVLFLNEAFDPTCHSSHIYDCRIKWCQT